MNNYRVILSLILLLVSVMLFGLSNSTIPAMAANRLTNLIQSRITEFTAIDGSCELLNEGEIITDNDAGITYSRGNLYRGAMVSDNPMVHGTSYILFDFAEDQETGDREVWVTTFIYPDQVDGAFILPGKGSITAANGPQVSHRGHGIGELAGLRIRVEAAAPTEEPSGIPCEPLFPPIQLNGTIIETVNQ